MTLKSHNNSFSFYELSSAESSNVGEKKCRASLNFSATRKTTKKRQQGNANSDLLVDQADIRPFPQAVVQVAQRVSRQIPSGQDERVGWDRGQNLSAELLDHAVSALVALTEIIRTHTSDNNVQLKPKNNAHWGK